MGAGVPDLTQSRLSRVESGAAELDADSLEAVGIAAATGVTTEWLSRPAIKQLEGVSPHFRARSRATQGTKYAGLAWAELVNEAHGILGQGIAHLPVTFEPRRGQDARAVARQFRRQLGFSALTPLPYLVLALERLGVRVLGLPWTCDTVDAFCAWSNSQPTIALVAGVPGDRRRWTTAHELGHLLLHDGIQQGREIEAAADAFAAELLTPLDGLRRDMPAHPTLKTLTMLKTQWGVSVKSLIRRARELGVVDDDRATGLYRQISARGWNKNEPGYVPVEKPRSLRLLIEISLPGNSPERLAEVMGWSVDLAQAVLGQHARTDELPVEAGDPPTSRDNVVSLRPRPTHQ